MVKLTNITFAYGDKTIIKGLNFTFPENGIVAIMGPSGCGKTTLLRLLAGLERPQGGAVDIGNCKISVAFQEPRLLKWLNAKENINFVLSRDNLSYDIADTLLEQFELSAHKNDLPEALSGGEQQRLSLARALAAGGNLLLLDEPFAALNEALKARISPFVKSANKNGLTILTTHSESDARLLGAEIFYCQGSPLTLLQKK